MMTRRIFRKIGAIGCIVALILGWLPLSPGHAQEDLLADLPALPSGVGDELGHDVNMVIDLIDEAGERITRTSLMLAIGDVFINQKNDLYEVVSVEENQARVALRGQAEMPDVSDALPLGKAPTFLDQVVRFLPLQAKSNPGTIAIYHSHGAESYEPTSGDAFKEDGGDVLTVGETLKQALEKQGYEVVNSEALHTPHDGGAYQRSRRTVAELNQKANPATMIDVHRDAVPDPNEYRTEVNGEHMTGIRLVVGRQNQNRDANLEYAKRIKAIADEEFPNLITGIFHAQGNYNQDFGPRMILMEFGTHLTSLEEANKSAEYIAQVLPAAAGLAPGTGGAAGSQIGQAALSTFWWLLGLAGVGTLAWLWLNREGLGLDKYLRRLGIGGDGGDQDNHE